MGDSEVVNRGTMVFEMDLNYRNLSKQQVITKYQRNLDILRRYAKEVHILLYP